MTWHVIAIMAAQSLADTLGRILVFCSTRTDWLGRFELRDEAVCLGLMDLVSPDLQLLGSGVYLAWPIGLCTLLPRTRSAELILSGQSSKTPTKVVCL